MLLKLLVVLCELGWLYKIVSNFLKYFNNNNNNNIVKKFIHNFYKSFCYSFQNELYEYYKLISFFKIKKMENYYHNHKNNNNNNIINNNKNLL